MITNEFIDRLIHRIDKIDKKNLQSYVLELGQDRNFLFSLFDHILEGVMVLSAKQEVVFINRRIRQLFDLSSEQSHERNYMTILQDTRLKARVQSALQERNEVSHENIEVLIPRPMLIKLSLRYETIMAKTYSVILIENISQNEILIREQFQKENWKSIFELAAGIAHEIGNPLNSINIHLKLLSNKIQSLKQKNTDPLTNELAILREETNRLDEIIRNFLRATRKKPLNYELTNINDLISKTVDFLRPELKESKIQVTQQLNAEIPLFLIDQDRMQQVFINLVKNSIQAMVRGGKLNIQTGLKDKLCFIQIQDTGVGIPESKLPKIFDAYFTTKEEGSGLGLMIAYQIISEHHGRIEATSKVNMGTTFRIVLPIRKEKLELPLNETSQKGKG
ncbi:MAG: hypothetical protein A3G33_07095 [Omnitrophica bacterium RIFCSPLOWO2_12_FULL_44_17]|uniref:histidine kinase n=1 Tax=Candidatus Danuiimicrobium aquiferis TaxID=1801832 RepID=A0A1G1KYK0_9BACT|nr:MAG: hypothetical protein A3B72_07390 [Omnitrophica bacterium RIFCSPHIGHO2_02_FULL_45_28]OGW91636.1 MAG: hypothetical protein A3E74_08130 [Omnitrophica bacterium RIFCSPHIGHO2_12_FULL_44_12]OGW97996.1 MAG: hypothetical protein A3G33_07095 [Omnitrophica bacterium RIFCSPLOWO2_12_FULL_44_17]OGX03560.1 MAG: hypothetical protein A3J12_03135 [Omnitrophica bacterium RIFCSPLOWO2_02_FULL_44_11]